MPYVFVCGAQRRQSLEIFRDFRPHRIPSKSSKIWKNQPVLIEKAGEESAPGLGAESTVKITRLCCLPTDACTGTCFKWAGDGKIAIHTILLEYVVSSNVAGSPPSYFVFTVCGMVSTRIPYSKNAVYLLGYVIRVCVTLVALAYSAQWYMDSRITHPARRLTRDQTEPGQSQDSHTIP